VRGQRGFKKKRIAISWHQEDGLTDILYKVRCIDCTSRSFQVHTSFRLFTTFWDLPSGQLCMAPGTIHKHPQAGQRARRIRVCSPALFAIVLPYHLVVRSWQIAEGEMRLTSVATNIVVIHLHASTAGLLPQLIFFQIFLHKHHSIIN
jgi:hypothetical protein